MPQAFLPIFSERMIHINKILAYEKKQGKIYYFLGQGILFSHDENDKESFRYITSQLINNGNVKQMDIVRAFNVSKSSVKRYVKKLRENGGKSIFKEKKKRKATVLTDNVILKIERRLLKGNSIPEISKELNLLPDTIRKGIKSKKIKLKKQTLNEKKENILDKSERIHKDVAAPMGRGTLRTQERLETSFLKNKSSAEIKFENNKDIAKGGILIALPLLLKNNLLTYTEKLFKLPKGYYDISSLFIILAFSILMRIKNIESIKGFSPGEFGKIIGLDRIPEIRTIREKMNVIANYKNSKEWGENLSKEWIEKYNNENKDYVYYIDGHIKIYYGEKANLPKKYKTQKRLCIPGISEYWVNDEIGKPYFYITKEIDDGLIKILTDEIVPRLIKETPEIKNEKNQKYQFGLVFDREGYSPKMFKSLWEKNKIVCYTYKKFVKDKWDKSEFKEYEYKLKNEKIKKLKLAEREFYHSKLKYKFREIRKLSETGHQTSIITTDFFNSIEIVAVRMFSRWTQENFFKYMMSNYGIDSLIEHKIEEINDTKKIKNPEYAKIEVEIRRINGILTPKKKKFTELLLPDFENNKTLSIEDLLTSEKLLLYEEIDEYNHLLIELKNKKKELENDKYIELSKLPEEEKFIGLSREKKNIIDLIKMISYRTETDMSFLITEKMSKPENARSFLKNIYTSDADIKIVNNNILEVSIHNLNNQSSDKILEHLCDTLNSTNTIFPNTNLRIFYKLVSS